MRVYPATIYINTGLKVCMHKHEYTKNTYAGSLSVALCVSVCVHDLYGVD